jgi:hypothetical protein
MKRGQFVQFNLIFVIIVGVVILAFFLFFTSKYIDLQQKGEAAEIGRDMDNIMRGIKSTTQHKNLSVVFNFNLLPNCEEIIINGKFSQGVDSIFFAEPSTSKKLVFWSKDFRKPFRVDTLVFIIDNSKKYYSSNPTFFPSFVNKGTANDYDVGVFFDGTCPTSSPERRVLCVDANNMVVDGRSFPFIDDVLVYGAAFSNVEQFECSFDRLTEKWANLFEIYSKKNEMLSSCTSVRAQLGEELGNAFNSIDAGVYTFDDARLDNLNNQLSNFECEVVY